MTTWTFVGVVVIAIIGYLFVSGFLATWRQYRGARIITCPENLEPAAVRVAAASAANSYALTGVTNLRLNTCSRWPEMAGCGQECLAQVESGPESCLVRSIVTSWYEGKSCAFCAKSIGDIVWHERPPALRRPDGTTVEWKELRHEDLPGAFAAGAPVCWPCHVRESFRRDHGELVIERPPHTEPRHAIPPSLTVY